MSGEAGSELAKTRNSVRMSIFINQGDIHGWDSFSKISFRSHCRPADYNYGSFNVVRVGLLGDVRPITEQSANIANICDIQLHGNTNQGKDKR